MLPSAFLCLLPRFQINLLPLILLFLIKICHAWLPDTSTKLVNSISKINSINFKGNSSLIDHFTVLYQDDNTILLGGRNQIYNLSVFDFTERKDAAIHWPSTEYYRQFCILKGKTEDDCQNYIRILFLTAPGKFLICGTHSYKPYCRIIQQRVSEKTSDFSQKLYF